MSKILNKDKYYLRIKGWKKISQTNTSNKQTSVAILIADKIYYKAKLLRRNTIYSSKEKSTNTKRMGSKQHPSYKFIQESQLNHSLITDEEQVRIKRWGGDMF